MPGRPPTWTARPRAAAVSAVALAALLAFGDWSSLGVSQGLLAQVKKPPVAKASWELRGTVVTETGAPAAGVSVTVRNRLFVGTVRTAADGLFAVTVPEAPAWNLSVIAKDATGDRQASFSRLSQTANAAELGPIRLVLEKPRSIAVTVTDGLNRPVEGATVGATSNFAGIGHERTNRDGKTALRIPRGIALQFVFAYKADAGLDYVAYRRTDQPASNPYMRSPDDRKPVSLVLAGARRVRVRVTDNQGRPIAGLRVDPWYFSLPKKGEDFNLSGLDLLASKSDAAGWTTFPMIPADNRGKITFWVRTEDYAVPERPMFDPAVKSNDITAVLVPLERVRGKVIFADGRPAANADVTAAGSGYQFDDFRGTTQCDAQGAFEIRVAPDQYYLFVAKLPRRVSDSQTRIVRAGLPVKAIHLVLEPATRVHGTITVGKDKRPVSRQYISLYLKPTADYYQLPKAQQLPSPPNAHKAIFPIIVESTSTDEHGRFEFFAGPGKYYVIGPTGTKPPEFEIKVQEQVEINFHTDRAERGPISGRVVQKAHPDRGVAEAKIDGKALEQTHFVDLAAVCNAQGKFEATRSLTNMLIGATSPDGSLSGIVRVSGDETNVTVPIGPNASARGRLIDGLTGAAVPDQLIHYGIRIEFAGGFSMTAFGGATRTDARGEFTLKNLTPGWKYDVVAVSTTRQDHAVRGYHHITSLEPQKAEVYQLGEVNLPQLYNPPTLDELADEFVQSQQPPAERLAGRLRDARCADQRLLLFAASPKTEVCRQFVSFYYRFSYNEDFELNDAVQNAFANYAILPLDASPNRLGELRPFLERLKLAVPAPGDAVLAILDVDGRLLAATTGKRLSEGTSLSGKRLIDFLKPHAPTMPDAEKLLSAAFEQAKREHKRVFVQVSSAFSNGGLPLCRYLDLHQALWERDYVRVRLDPRFENGVEVISRLRKKPQPGTLFIAVMARDGTIQKIPSHANELPWMIILDAAGNTLTTSDGADGNIGFPSGTKRISHFRKMIRDTARRLTDAQIELLIRSLNSRAWN